MILSQRTDRILTRQGSEICSSLKSMIHLTSHNFKRGQKKAGLGQSFSVLLEKAPRQMKCFERISQISEINSKTLPGPILKNSSLDLHIRSFFWQSLTAIYQSLSHPDQPLAFNWSGDPSIGHSTVLGFLQKYTQGIVLWIDAHANVNTPVTSLSQYLRGMPIAFMLNIDGIALLNFPFLKYFLQSQQSIYWELRDLDPGEIKVKIGNSPLHISFDVDVIDPTWMPSTGVPVTGEFQRSDLYKLGHLSQHSENLKCPDQFQKPQFPHHLTKEKYARIC